MGITERFFKKDAIFFVLFLVFVAWVIIISSIVYFLKTKPTQSVMSPKSVYQQPKDAELRKAFEAAVRASNEEVSRAP